MISLKKIWKNKWRILEGLWFNHVVFTFARTHWARKFVEERRELCSLCPHLDQKGEGPLVVIKGYPACEICGCNIKELTASLSSVCSMVDLGLEPMWKPIRIKNDYKIENKILTQDKQNGEIY